MDLSVAAIFGAGLLTFASPCVLPLMPIYLATLVGGTLADARPGRAMRLALSFSLGFSLVFIALGAVASTLGGMLVRHRFAITLISGLLMLLFGLRSLGVLRMRALDVDARPALQRVRATSSLAGAFVFGAAFALGWSPCIGPVLASVLTFAATHADSPWQGAAYLGAYASGLAAPLLLIAAGVSRAAAILKSFRRAIPIAEKVTGGALLAIGVWTLVGLAPIRDDLGAAATARTPAPASLAGEPTSCDAEGLCDLPAAASDADAAAAAHLDPERDVQGAHILEFTAHECPVCKKMRPVIDNLVAACRELEPRIVRVDVATARGRALAMRHGVRGTPTFVLFDEVGTERARLLGEQSSNDVAAAVERTLGFSCAG